MMEHRRSETAARSTQHAETSARSTQHAERQGSLHFRRGCSCLLYTSDAAWWNALVSTLLVSYFGPYRAEQLFECTPMHKMPVVLMPALLVMAFLSK